MIGFPKSRWVYGMFIRFSGIDSSNNRTRSRSRVLLGMTIAKYSRKNFKQWFFGSGSLRPPTSWSGDSSLEPLASEISAPQDMTFLEFQTSDMNMKHQETSGKLKTMTSMGMLNEIFTSICQLEIHCLGGAAVFARHLQSRLASKTS